MKVVIDTNVFISALITPAGKAHQIINLWQNERIEIVISEPIINEYEKVLKHLSIKYIKTLTKIEIKTFINQLKKFTLYVFPKEKINIITADPDDNKFIEAAFEGQAEYIISGDRHLLNLGNYRGIRIISLKAFLIHYSILK